MALRPTKRNILSAAAALESGARAAVDDRPGARAHNANRPGLRNARPRASPAARPDNAAESRADPRGGPRLKGPPPEARSPGAISRDRTGRGPTKARCCRGPARPRFAGSRPPAARLCARGRASRPGKANARYCARPVIAGGEEGGGGRGMRARLGGSMRGRPVDRCGGWEEVDGGGFGEG